MGSQSAGQQAVHDVFLENPDTLMAPVASVGRSIADPHDWHVASAVMGDASVLGAIKSASLGLKWRPVNRTRQCPSERMMRGIGAPSW
jgi:hypothetical protein